MAAFSSDLPAPDLRQNGCRERQRHVHIDAALSEAIVTAGGEIVDGQHPDQFPVDAFQTGSGTSTNMNVNEVIASLAATATGQAVHQGSM